MMPLIFGSGERIFLVEVDGARTGRADLCTVIGTDNGKLILSRMFCWAEGKTDDDLSFLGLTVTASDYPTVTEKVLGL